LSSNDKVCGGGGGGDIDGGGVVRCECGGVSGQPLHDEPYIPLQATRNSNTSRRTMKGSQDTRCINHVNKGSIQ